MDEARYSTPLILTTNESDDSGNISDNPMMQYDPTFATVMRIELVCLPVICIFGLLGNTLSTITFLRKPLRNSPCSFFLAVRGISDNGFLISLLLVWASSTFDLRLSQIKGVCQFIVFMTYLCGCVSVWLCVFITFVNFLLIHTPYQAKQICSERWSKFTVVTLYVLALGFYATPLWIMNGDCSHNANYTTLTQVLVYMDTVLTLVLPTILISVFLFIITYKLLHVIHRRRINFTMRDQDGNILKKRNSLSIPIAKVTKMLFVVTVTFFILNIPSHAIRLRLMIGSFIKGHASARSIEATLQTIFQLIYYLSFSVNIVLYLVCGSNFRKTFNKTFNFCITRKHSPYVSREAVNRVRQRKFSQTSIKMDKEHSNLLAVAPVRRCHSH